MSLHKLLSNVLMCFFCVIFVMCCLFWIFCILFFKNNDNIHYMICFSFFNLYTVPLNCLFICLHQPMSATLSSAKWGLPQTRARVYFVLVRKDVADQATLDAVYHDVLPNVVLPAFMAQKSDVKEIRKYVEGVCQTLDWSPTYPTASQDRAVISGVVLWCQLLLRVDV